MLPNAHQFTLSFLVRTEYAEQRSDEIWAAVKWSIKACIEGENINTRLIKGIAFTATCSTALVGHKLPTG